MKLENFALVSLVFWLSACGSGLYVAESSRSGTGGDDGGGSCSSSPTLSSVSPVAGAGAGGETITLTGTGFKSCDLPTSILLGTASCTSPTFVSSTQLTCTSSAGKGGYNDVSATFSAGTRTLSKSFVYHFQRTFLNQAGGEGLNKNAAKEAWTGSSIVEFDDKIYAAWGEYGGSGTVMQLRVAVNSGTDTSPSWQFVDGDHSTDGLNLSATKAISNPKLFVVGTDLYVAWNEAGSAPATGQQIRVKKYNGNDSAPAWSWAGSAGDTQGLNYDQTRNGSVVSCVGFDSKAYCAWSELTASASQMRVKRFDGTTWDFVDGGAATGLNKDSSRNAGNPNLFELDSKLYLAWSEVSSQGSNPTNIRVAVYNGDDDNPAWTFVDGNGAAGLGYDTTKAAFGASSATTFNGKLILAWGETDGTTRSMRVARYNGNDSSPSWSFIDGNGAKGINKTNNTYRGYVGVVHGRLTLLFQEGPSDLAVGARIASYNGNDSSPAWSLTDGNTATLINNNGGAIFSGGPADMIFLADRAYAIWTERAGTGWTGVLKARVLKIQ